MIPRNLAERRGCRNARPVMPGSSAEAPVTRPKSAPKAAPKKTTKTPARARRK